MEIIILLTIMGTLNQDTSPVLFQSSDTKALINWYVVDDGVMGGISEGKLVLNAEGNMLYTGVVRLENNGGFSSLRHRFATKKTSMYTYVVLTIKGDGKSYQFRIKSEGSQRFSYIQPFETSGSWETLKLRLDSFYPSFRGTTLNKPNYPAEKMEEIAFLIGNKRREAFSLEIEQIYLE